MKKTVLSLLFVLFSWGTADAQSWIITGRVVDANGAGIQGIDVDITPTGGGSTLLLSQDFSGIDGTFSLTVVEIAPIGFYDIIYKAPAGSTFIDTVIPNTFLFGSTDVGTTTLLQQRSIRGAVVDESGIGIDRIDSQVRNPAGELLDIGQDDTDQNGLYRLFLGDATWNLEFRQVVPGPVQYLSTFLPPIDLMEDTRLPTAVMLEGFSVTGAVQDALGAGVGGVDLDVFDNFSGDLLRTSGDTTATTGLFDFLAPAREIRIEVKPGPLSAFVPQELLWTVAAPPELNAIPTVVLETGFDITGLVTDAALVGVAAVDLDVIDTATGIELFTPDDNTDATGNYSVRVPPGIYDVIIRPTADTGLVPQRILALDATLASVAAPDVNLAAGVSLTGSVTDGLAPIEDVEVTLVDSLTGTPILVTRNDTNVAGTYSIRVPAGNYDVTFTPEPVSGGLPLTLPAVDVTLDTILDTTLLVDPTPAVLDLACVTDTWNVVLTWTNGAVDYDRVEIFRDGVLLTTLPGDAIEYSDFGLFGGSYEYDVVPIRGGVVGPGTLCAATVVEHATNVACTVTGSTVALTWINGELDYEEILVLVNGAVVATLPGTAVDTVVTGVPVGVNAVAIQGVRAGLESYPIACTADVLAPVSAVTCESTGSAVTLTWVNGALDYGTIEILRDGVVVGSTTGSATTFTDSALADASYLYAVRPVRTPLFFPAVPADPVECFAVVGPETPLVGLLACATSPFDVTVSWDNGLAVFDRIEVQRDGVLVGTLLPTETSFFDPGLPAGFYEYTVQGVIAATFARPQSCVARVVTEVPPVLTLGSTVANDDVLLTWQSPPINDYEAVEVRRNGVLVTTLPVGTTEFTDIDLADQVYDYEVMTTGFTLTSPATTAVAEVDFIYDFQRGDTNGDAVYDISDVVTVIAMVFGFGALPECLDVADANDDGIFDVSDPVYLLGYLFLGEAAPPAPFGVLGPDPTPDALECPPGPTGI